MPPNLSSESSKPHFESMEFSSSPNRNHSGDREIDNDMMVPLHIPDLYVERRPLNTAFRAVEVLQEELAAFVDAPGPGV